MPPVLAPNLSEAQKRGAAKGAAVAAPKRCMVTGGTGFVGQRLVEMLVERGAERVVSFDIVPKCVLRACGRAPRTCRLQGEGEGVGVGAIPGVPAGERDQSRWIAVGRAGAIVGDEKPGRGCPLRR